MKTFRNTLMAAVALFMGISLTACSDANEYKDADTNNPTFDTTHPETVDGTKWVRGSGIKYNVNGQEVQGFVESLDFTVEADENGTQQVEVKMSEGVTKGTWLNDAGTYEYTYSHVTGKIDILKSVTDDKGKVSKSVLFTGIVNSNVLTLAHFGDTPIQTYLVKQ